MNEVSKIFDQAGITTQDVISAAATKWNFVPFTPGLVGGHCIGVDPYYLAHFAQSVGADPHMILSGRQTNDGMVKHVKEAVLSMLITGSSIPQSAKVGVFGITFKENVPDIRNSKSIELVHDLQQLGLNLFVHDAHCTRLSAAREEIELSQVAQMGDLDVMVVSCAHDAYLDDPRFLDRLKPDGALIDLRGAFRDRDLGGRRYWTL
jgi:UDP-N-acetyl-D-galactosamine dehydrogenase